MSDPSDTLGVDRKKGYTMFVYLVTTTDGFTTRVVTSGDPTDHPAFWGRVLSVETLGEEGNLLSLVSDPSAKV
jgi:hypothetical protein